MERRFFVFSTLTQFIRNKARSRTVVVGTAVVATLALAGGWALAGSNSAHQATGKALLSSARNVVPAKSESTVTENGTAPQTVGSQGSTGSHLAPVALGPESVKKQSPKRPDPGHHKSSKTTCPSGGVPTPGSTINGGLVIDGDCTITGVIVNGGIVVGGNGHLTLYKSTVNGGTSVQRNGEFDSDNPSVVGGGNLLNGGVSEDHAFDMDLWNSTVQGSVRYTGGPLGVGYFYGMCGTTVQGDVTIDSIVSAEIGDQFNCARNTITGSVHIRNTGTMAVELEFATIGGSVDLWNSHPAVAGDTIGGSLLCHQGATLHHFDVDDTVANTVHGTNTCV
jgi:hypothetical protein